MTTTACALCEDEEKDDDNAVRDDEDVQDDDDLHQAGVHVEPAVVDAPVVVVLEAHVEQDDEGGHAPPNLRITISLLSLSNYPFRANNPQS